MCRGDALPESDSEEKGVPGCDPSDLPKRSMTPPSTVIRAPSAFHPLRASEGWELDLLGLVAPAGSPGGHVRAGRFSKTCPPPVPGPVFLGVNYTHSDICKERKWGWGWGK